MTHQPLALHQRMAHTKSIAESAPFKELVRKRTGLVSAALWGTSIWFGLFIILTAYAHDFMATMVLPGLTLAYVLGLSQFVSVWIMTTVYLRSSTATFVPLQEEALNSVVEPKADGAI